MRSLAPFLLIAAAIVAVAFAIATSPPVGDDPVSSASQFAQGNGL